MPAFWNASLRNRGSGKGQNDARLWFFNLQSFFKNQICLISRMMTLSLMVQCHLVWKIETNMWKSGVMGLSWNTVAKIGLWSSRKELRWFTSQACPTPRTTSAWPFPDLVLSPCSVSLLPELEKQKYFPTKRRTYAVSLSPSQAVAKTHVEAVNSLGFM